MDGHDLARRALTHLGAGLPLPEDVRTWMLSGLRDYLEQGHTLDGALGLQTEPGGHYDRPHIAQRLTRRDAEIRAVAFWTFPELSAWQAAGRTVELMQAHVAGEPLGLVDNGHPTHHLLARLSGESLSRRQIHRILCGDRSS